MRRAGADVGTTRVTLFRADGNNLTARWELVMPGDIAFW